MNCSSIMSVLIDKRTEAAVEVQGILTEYGCSIHARFGLHEAGKGSCEEEGLIILYLCDKDTVIRSLESDLAAVNGVTVRQMSIR